MIRFQDGMIVSGRTEAIVRIRTEKERKEMKELGLHPAGAYNMLADMLEDQDGTLTIMKKGIRRK